MPHLLHWSVSVHHMSFFLVRAQNFTISNVNHEKRRIETPIERYPTPLFIFYMPILSRWSRRQSNSPSSDPPSSIIPFLILLPQIISHPSNPPSGPSKSEDLIWHSCDTRRHLSATPSIKLAFFLSIPPTLTFFHQSTFLPQTSEVQWWALKGGGMLRQEQTWTDQLHKTILQEPFFISHFFWVFVTT